MTISVSQADIDNGKPNDCEQCPVALALRRATGNDWSVTELQAQRLPTGAPLWLPSPVESFIRRFDSGYSVRPFNFAL